MAAQSVTHSSQHGAAYPAVAEIRKLLEEVPGNDDLNTRWQWEQARHEGKGLIRVPGAKGGVDLLIALDAASMEQQLAQSLLVAEGRYQRNLATIVLPSLAVFSEMRDRVERGELAPGMVAADKMYNEYLHRSTRPRPIGGRFSPEHRRLWFESVLAHEVRHAEYQGEEAAYRQSFGALIASGKFIPPGPNGSLALVLLTSGLEIYGTSLAERFNGEPVSEFSRWLPGGESYARLIADVAQFLDRADPQAGAVFWEALSSLRDPAQAEKACERVLAGIHTYFAMRYREQYAKQHGLNEREAAAIFFGAPHPNNTVWQRIKTFFAARKVSWDTYGYADEKIVPFERLVQEHLAALQAAQR